jgi:epoxyqueuosine reductase
MDVYWAQMAGLGWQGKNTLLVSRTYGCRLSLGALMIDIPVDNYDQPHSNHCGNCTACIDSCPTQTLIKPYVLDASKCISYWTIESKADIIPDSIRAEINNWVFGCDICLDACPFNRFSKPCTNESLSHRENITLLETGEVARLSEHKFENLFSKSPIKRPGFKGIQRNITAISKTPK